MSTDDFERLDALMRAVRADSTRPLGPQPLPGPHVDQDPAHWRAEVARARRAADEHALAHRARVDRISRQLFGVTASDLLPPLDAPLTRATVHVPVPADPQLGSECAGPRGPGARAAGPQEVRVAITAPPSPTASIVRLHGGAFWMGGGSAGDRIDSALIDQLATQVNAAVLNVDYRLAPEHPFPASIVDTLCVLDAVREGLLGAPTGSAPIALVGTSSGANIATAAAKADALRREHPPITALALLVPSVLLADVPSQIRDNQTAWETRRRQLFGYLGSERDAAQVDAADTWVSLADVTALAGMPPTFAAIARHDEIAVGGARLCEAIIAGGSPATAVEYVMTHTVAPPEVEAAMIGDIVAFLRTSLYDGE